MRNEHTFNYSLLIQGIMSKYNETVENTIFELMHIANCTALSQLSECGYEIKKENQGTKTKISLWHSQKHIITYTIYINSEDFMISIKRERKVNNLDPETEDIG